MEIYFNQIRYEVFINEMRRHTRLAEIIYDEMESYFSGLDCTVWQDSGLYELRKALEKELTSLVLVLRRHIAYLDEVTEAYQRKDNKLKTAALGMMSAVSPTGRIVSQRFAGSENSVLGASISALEQNGVVYVSALPSEILNVSTQWRTADMDTLPFAPDGADAEMFVGSDRSLNASLSMYTNVLYGTPSVTTTNARYINSVMRYVDGRPTGDETLTEAEIAQNLIDFGTEYGWFQMDVDDAWEMAQDGYPMLLTWSGFMGVACPETPERHYIRVEVGKLKTLPFIPQEYQGRDLKLYIHQAI